jgi:hypothetical protein
MDPSTKITLEDGSEMTLGELMQARKDLQEATSSIEELKNDLSEVGYLFRADAPGERRMEAVRHVLMTLGYDDDQINQYVEATSSVAQQPAEDDEVEEIELPDLPDEDDNIEDSSGGEQEDTMSAEREQILRQELEAQRAELHKMRVRELRDNLNSELDRALKRNPDIQKLIESARISRGDEGVKQAEQTLRTQLEQRALERMQARRSAAGTFEDAWMSEEVEKAVEPVVGTFRSVIGDIDRLGRSSETVTGLDAQEILRSKPVPAPEYKAGMTLTDVESDVKSFASDMIKRALASSPGESVV